MKRMKPKNVVRQNQPETQKSSAQITASEICNTIRAHHRQRRFAMKMQQKIDRALESYVRINFTEWTPDEDEKKRSVANAKVEALIKAARKGEGDDSLIHFVTLADGSRAPWDKVRKEQEAAMAALAKQLPIYTWIKEQRGVGEGGLANIIAETGDLSNYANVAKVWRRLGFAPYDGYAGSTWKRPSWRPRALRPSSNSTMKANRRRRDIMRL
jgi:hypothetical protein